MSTSTSGWQAINATADIDGVLTRHLRHGIVRHGVGGQVAVTVTYREDYGYDTVRDAVVTFIGSIYGHPGPVTLVTGGVTVFIDSPERFGDTLDLGYAVRFLTATGRDER